MNEILGQIFSTGLMPHGYCIQWRPGLLWLHVVSDALIALAYFAIPLGLYYVIRRRGDLPFPALFGLAGAFILACGTTHLLAIWTIWRPDYGLEGLVKAATAGISVLSAIVFLRLAPRILELPNIHDLEDRVAEKTKQLSEANEELRLEIEQRDEVEKTLAERESRLRSIVDTAVNAILTIDEHGVVESLNPATERLFGYTEAEVLGRNVSMLMGSPERESHDGYLKRYCETGERRIIGIGREVTGRRQDGAAIPLDLAVSEFQSAQGRRFTGVLRDISERKETERRLARSMEELAERESRLRSVVDTAVNAILTIDEHGTVRSINPAGVRLFGYQETEVLGQNVSMMMGSPDRESHDGYLERYCRTGERRIIGIGREVTGRRKDGVAIPLDLAVSEFQSAHGRRFTGVLRDISERKEAERRLAEFMEELAAANRALQDRNGELDDFAHTVSHDLKEPLRGIQTYCWTLSEDLGDQMPEEARAGLERMQTLAKRMHAMVESVLEYSRSGRETGRAKTDLNEVVQEALDMLHAPLHERGCDVRIPRPFPEADCDPVALVESLKNLISNASKYNDKAEKWIEVGWEREDDAALTVYVRDNGIGIGEADRKNVFRIFHRVHREADFGEGSGAGLAIVKKLVERQGGRVWVDSVPGQGSTFRFTLGGGGKERT